MRVSLGVGYGQAVSAVVSQVSLRYICGACVNEVGWDSGSVEALVTVRMEGRIGYCVS